MTQARKKVIVRTVSNLTYPGYLPVGSFVDHSCQPISISLLNLAGRIESIPLRDIQYIAYVRDFNLPDTQNPERLTRKTFLARPRTEGLWLRLTLLGGALIEGLAATDISLVDTMLADAGIFIIPPDVRSNTQRLFLPRAAISSLQLLAVITTPSKTKAAAGKPAVVRPKDLQSDLFPEPSGSR